MEQPLPGIIIFYYEIYHSLCVSGTGDAFFFFWPKHPVVKQESPAPNESPSSNVCGIGWSIVSGKNIVQMPASIATEANIAVGILISNVS